MKFGGVSRALVWGANDVDLRLGMRVHYKVGTSRVICIMSMSYNILN